MCGQDRISVSSVSCDLSKSLAFHFPAPFQRADDIFSFDHMFSFWQFAYLFTRDTVFFFFLLPEMKDRSLEELDELFQNRVSVRDFKKYQCVSSERAKEVAMKETTGEEKRVEVVEMVEDTTDSKV